MKLWLTALLLLVGFNGQSQPPAQQSPEQNLVGTWRRYSNHRLIEVFVMRPDHSWASDLYDAKGGIIGKEKGKWEQQAGHITFSFSLPADPPATAPFTFRNDRVLVIGKNVYYR